MNKLEEKINYRFKDTELLELALTHCSYSAEHNTKNNQRLEFLGDAVLEHAMSDYIFKKYPDYDEGQMTRLRASIVSEVPLAFAAEEIELYDFVKLGSGEKNSGGARKKSVLSDTLESVFAAVYLDGGYENAERVILAVLKRVIENPQEKPKDYKTELQEYLFRNGTVKVEYVTLSAYGPPHAQTFEVGVYCDGRLLGTGSGTSKKRAEQAAAKEALTKHKK